MEEPKTLKWTRSQSTIVINLIVISEVYFCERVASERANWRPFVNTEEVTEGYLRPNLILFICAKRLQVLCTSEH